MNITYMGAVYLVTDIDANNDRVIVKTKEREFEFTPQEYHQHHTRDIYTVDDERVLVNAAVTVESEPEAPFIAVEPDEKTSVTKLEEDTSILLRDDDELF